MNTENNVVDAQNRPSTDGQRVQEFLQSLLSKMHFDDCVVEMNENGENIEINIKTDDQGSVIGYRGEVLSALQYLSGLILGNDNKSYKRVTVDCEGYREKREKTLIQLAKNLEQKVKRTKRAVKLEPMNPYERRIIHTALQNSQYVTTESEGVQNNRHVVISPKIDNDILNAPTAHGRKSLNFVYSSDKKRRR